MSNEPGRAFFRDGTVYWFEYQGSGECACPLLFVTREDQKAAFLAQDRATNIDLETTARAEPVVLDTLYGGGLWWCAGAVRVPHQAITLTTPGGQDIVVTVGGFITHRQASSDPDEWNGWGWSDGLYRPWPGMTGGKARATGSDDIVADLDGYDPGPLPAHKDATNREEEFGAKINADDRRALLAASGRTFFAKQ